MLRSENPPPKVPSTTSLLPCPLLSQSSRLSSSVSSHPRLRLTSPPRSCQVALLTPAAPGGRFALRGPNTGPLNLLSPLLFDLSIRVYGSFSVSQAFTDVICSFPAVWTRDTTIMLLHYDVTGDRPLLLPLRDAMPVSCVARRVYGFGCSSKIAKGGRPARSKRARIRSTSMEDVVVGIEKPGPLLFNLS